VNRVVVFGRGGAGKSTLSRSLGDITGLPVIELDKVYWNENLDILTESQWVARQNVIVGRDSWIIDGDLGPFDVTEPRLSRADTVILMTTPLLTCLWRASRRGRQRLDFWIWVVTWGVRHKPAILADITAFAPSARVVELSTQKEIDAWLSGQSTK
jgi:adenylate kinase family enzyme